MNLMEAFKALDQLNEDVFSVDAEGIKKLNDFMQNDDSVDELSVFDIDSTEDDVIRPYHTDAPRTSLQLHLLAPTG